MDNYKESRQGALLERCRLVGPVDRGNCTIISEGCAQRIKERLSNNEGSES